MCVTAWTAGRLRPNFFSNRDGTFGSEHELRDTIAGEQRPISDWEQPEPFATQAELARKASTERAMLEVGVHEQQQPDQAFAGVAVLVLVTAGAAGGTGRAPSAAGRHR